MAQSAISQHAAALAGSLPAMPKQPTTPGNRYGLSADEETLTALAAAVYVARAAYREALTMPDPAKTLDDIVDALPEVMPEVFAKLGTSPDVAAVMLPAITDRVRAYTVVERARSTWNPDYLYALDILADGLNKGGDPASVRADVHRIADQVADMAVSQ